MTNNKRSVLVQNQSHQSHRPQALRWIAAFEALKGTLAIALVLGLVSLLHHDLRHIVHNIIGHYGFNDGGHFPSLLEHWADILADTSQLEIVALACLYVVVRLTEAYGLWHGRAWGEWLTAISGGIYLPFEWLHLWHRHSWSAALVFLFNLLMVAYLVHQLWQRLHQR